MPKTKAQKLEQEKRDRQKWDRLILCAIQKKDVADLFQLFYDALSYNQQQDLHTKIADDILAMNGYVVIGGLNFLQADKIVEFVEKEIYPATNDQFKNLFAYQ